MDPVDLVSPPAYQHSSPTKHNTFEVPNRVRSPVATSSLDSCAKTDEREDAKDLSAMVYQPAGLLSATAPSTLSTVPMGLVIPDYQYPDYADVRDPLDLSVFGTRCSEPSAVAWTSQPTTEVRATSPGRYDYRTLSVERASACCNTSLP